MATRRRLSQSAPRPRTRPRNRPRHPRRLCRAIAAGALLLSPCLLTACNLDRNSDTTLLADLVPGDKSKTPVQAATDMLDMEDPDNRRRGVGIIAAAPWGGEEVYVRTYRLLMTDEDETVRAAAINALGLHGSPDDAAAIAALLANRIEHDPESFRPDATRIAYTEPDPLVRWEASKALQRLHNPAAADNLIQAVTRDEEADIRAAAADALGQYARSDVFDVLVGALNDPRFIVNYAARKSLTTLTGRDLGADSRDWLNFREDHRPDLFAGQKPYTYTPWSQPPSWWKKLQPWHSGKRKPPMPTTPTGL